MSGAFHEAAVEGVTASEADFVIVGSGAGGGAAARVLSRAGRSVAVLEEGPLAKTSELQPVLNQSMATLFRGRGRTAAMGKVPIPFLQGRCVGGTTFVNSAIIWRLPEKILARWQHEHGLADDFREGELGRAFDELESELHVQEVQPDAVTQSDRLMRDGAQKAGIESRTIRRNESGCKGSGRCFHGCPSEAKQSTAVNSLRRAVHDGANVFAGARVERVVVQGGRAVAVEGRSAQSGKPFRVQARKAVVVSASAVQSPNLLRKSGVRGPHLGEHFMSHPGSSVSGLYAERVDMWSGASQGYEAYGLRDTVGVKFETINVPPEVAASRLPGAGRKLAGYLERLDKLAVWAVALRADAEGSVRPSWLLGDLVRYQLTRHDVERLRAGVAAAARMHFLAGALEVLPGVHGAPEVLTSMDQVKAIEEGPLDAGAYALLCTHLFGGCRASAQASGGVVDGKLRVHGVDGLYVMDASVFPSNTGVNPQHSIMALSHVAASRLASA